jgi:hypothetical protein
MRALTPTCGCDTADCGIDAAKLSHMPAKALRVLLIQSWIIGGAEVRDALRSNGYEPLVYRVDFESALAAALPRGVYDVIVLDCRSTGIARSHVETLMRDHGVRAPLVEIMPGRPLGDDVTAALAATRN